MPPVQLTQPENLLSALLDSWERNNTILLNLLEAIPKDALTLRAMAGSPTIAELFTHIHFVRLTLVLEDAPECAKPLPEREWVPESNRTHIAQILTESASAVKGAVKSRLEGNSNFDVHYDHPTLLLQHLIWHEGYHHGQIKLVLKLAGCPISNQKAGPLTWQVWMRKL